MTLLGCGGSGGVPVLGKQPGGDWGACDPANPRNRRTRVSVLVEEGGRRLLIDTSPDMREQLIAAGVGELEAVAFTHAHADHLHGIDDLRGVCRIIGKPLAVWAAPLALQEITQRFPYAFRPLKGDYFYRPALVANPIQGPFEAAGMTIVPFDQDHGLGLASLGFRIGRFAYSTDVKTLDDAAFAMLAGVDLWIVDCLQENPHETHSHLDQTLAWIARVKPRQAILTHMNQTLDYEDLRRKCPPGVEPGHDGMVFDLPTSN